MQKKYNAIIIAALVLIVLVILVAIFIYPVETEKEIETKEEVKQCKYYINKDIAISGDWDTSTHLINGEFSPFFFISSFIVTWIASFLVDGFIIPWAISFLEISE